MKLTSMKRALLAAGILAAGSLSLVACDSNAVANPTLPTTVPTIAISGAPVPPEVLARHRALLDSLEVYPGATLIREYISPAGGLGREYASDRPMPEAPTVISVFYRDTLKARGFQTLQEHAAVSAYDKAGQVVQVLRNGPERAQPTFDEKTLASFPVPAEVKFFYALRWT
jgi:hypothetical protein